MPDIPAGFAHLPSSQQSLLRRFRSDHKKRLPLHPLERAVLTVVTLHLCFLPWALGAMGAWGQVTSLVLSAVGMALALIPRTYSGEQALPGEMGKIRGDETPKIGGSEDARVGGFKPSNLHLLTPSSLSVSSGFRSQVSAFRLSPFPRLLRFPLFWIGLALLAYIAIQGFNPSWIWERNATSWWLRRVNDIAWLPTSIDTPFERFNLWRQFIIYASAWLTVCTIWVGLTRRRSFEILLTAFCANAAILAITGFVCRMFRPWEFLLWLDEPLRGATTFASFIYKNHAGGWLALAATACVFLAAVRHQRSAQKMERSSPAVLFVLGAALVFFAEIFTLSRGGTVLLAAYLLLALVVFFVHRRLTHEGSTTHPLVPAIVALLFVAVIGYTASLLDYRSVERRFELLFGGGKKDVSLAFRQEAHLASTEMLGDHWQRGVGAGGFRFLFPNYARKHPAIHNGGRFFWEHAHNDWFQIPIELGAAGTLILIVGTGYWLVGLAKRKVWRDLPALLLVLGLGQTLLHAIFDFPFQNPAILTTWCALAVLTLRRLEWETA